MRTILLIVIFIIIVMFFLLFNFLKKPKFGTNPKALSNSSSTNFSKGEFQNLIETSTLKEGQTNFKLLLKHIFSKKEKRFPHALIPTVKTDLKNLAKNKNVLIWLGHSSYYIQLEGQTILVDPVFSDSAAPISFFNKAFKGTNIYTENDMPEIDYLFITHDHWDHLDYPTVISLAPKIKNIVTGLGVGLHFISWGFPKEMIHEGDWFSSIELNRTLKITILPARHFSGRLFNQNKTLWVGFAFKTPNFKLFLSGDSGYSSHFKEIGKSFKGFDLVILDNGQYDGNWPYIHMNPQEASQAAQDLQAEMFLAGHVGKFSIANHFWDAPFIGADLAARDKSYRLLTPKIGQVIDLEQKNQFFSRWWENID